MLSVHFQGRVFGLLKQIIFNIFSAFGSNLYLKVQREDNLWIFRRLSVGRLQLNPANIKHFCKILSQVFLVEHKKGEAT